MNDANEMKFCKYCGKQIKADTIFCTECGKQVENIPQTQTATPVQPQIIINNVNTNTNANFNAYAFKKPKNKWAAFFLCLFIGFWGAHKFYEGKIGMGILYLFTCGLFGIGWFVDTLILLFKPNPYYV